MKPFIASQCVDNENRGFMCTYIPCYIGSEEKVSLTKTYFKTRMNKRSTYLSRCSLSFRLSLFFHYSTSDIAPRNKKRSILVKNFTASSLFIVGGAILNQ